MIRLREILFRGKRTDNGEWVYGFPYIGVGLDKGKCLLTEVSVSELSSRTYWVDKSTVGQYIGLVDKNDNLIVEGDLLSLLDGKHRGVVIWSDHDQCYFVSPNGDEHTSLGDFGNYGRDDYYEVIGNIYDDPEVLHRGDPKDEP